PALSFLHATGCDIREYPRPGVALAAVIPGSLGGLSLHVSAAKYSLCRCGPAARVGWSRCGDPPDSILAPIPTDRDLAHSDRMATDRRRSDPGADFDQDRDTAHRMELVICAHRDLADRCSVTLRGMAGQARMARPHIQLSRDARDHLPGRPRSRRLRRALCSPELADAESDSESHHASRNHERRRRRPRRAILPQFSAVFRPSTNSHQVFFGVRLVQALPRRYL